MDTVSPRHKSTNLTAFITSFSAAIVVGLGLAILAQAFIFSITHLLGLGSTFLWVASIVNAIFSAWVFAWTFARSWHVERRLREGLEVDEPKLSILANLGSSTKKR